MQLSAEQAAACGAVVGAPQAWCRADELAEAHGAEVVAGLAAAGVLVAWDRPDYLAVTLSPWGAWLLGVEIDEVWRPETEEREERNEARPIAPAEVWTERVLVEMPVWRPAGHEERPIVLPRHMRIGRSIPVPARVPDPATERDVEYVCDEEGNPVTVFGAPVAVDRRVRGKRA